MEDLFAGFWGMFPGVSEQARLVVNLVVVWFGVSAALVLLNSVLSMKWFKRSERDGLSALRKELAATQQVLNSYQSRPFTDRLGGSSIARELRSEDREGENSLPSSLPITPPSPNQPWRRSGGGAALLVPANSPAAPYRPGGSTPVPPTRVDTLVNRPKKRRSAG